MGNKQPVVVIPETHKDVQHPEDVLEPRPVPRPAEPTQDVMDELRPFRMHFSPRMRRFWSIYDKYHSA